MSQLLLIVPCFNEEKRIDLNAFLTYFTTSSAGIVDFLFANDGSKDNTSKLITDFIKNNNLSANWFVFDNPLNTGKAGVIYNAYQESKKTKIYDWYGYWDADLATPLFEIQNMMKFRELFYARREVIFGSRIMRQGSRIVRNPLRHYLGRLFVTVAYLMLKVGSYDSQCGAKIMSRFMAEKAFNEPFISGWIFDIEIMLRVGENNITEYPLIEWVDVPGSKVKIAQEAFRILKELFLIKEKYNR